MSLAAFCNVPEDVNSTNEEAEVDPASDIYLWCSQRLAHIIHKINRRERFHSVTENQPGTEMKLSMGSKNVIS